MGNLWKGSTDIGVHHEQRGCRWTVAIGYSKPSCLKTSRQWWRRHGSFIFSWIYATEKGDQLVRIANTASILSSIRTTILVWQSNFESVYRCKRMVKLSIYIFYCYRCPDRQWAALSVDILFECFTKLLLLWYVSINKTMVLLIETYHKSSSFVKHSKSISTDKAAHCLSGQR